METPGILRYSLTDRSELRGASLWIRVFLCAFFNGGEDIKIQFVGLKGTILSAQKG